jgi:hypothetical protein
VTVQVQTRPAADPLPHRIETGARALLSRYWTVLALLVG